MSRKLSPWARIYRAVERGTGVRLSADDVERLASDDAVMARGKMDYTGDEDRDPHSDCLRLAGLQTKQVRRKLVVSEGIEGRWYYHLSKKGTESRALCGAKTMHTCIPLTAWGTVTHLREKWCEICEAQISRLER